MRRRRFLGLFGVGFGLGTAGCSSDDSPGTGSAGGPTPGGRSSPPEYDCSEAGRPTLTDDVRERGDSVEPLDYPDGPPPLGDDEAFIEYVKQYERALVRKRVRSDTRGRVTGFGLSGDARTFDAPPDAAIVRFRYSYYYGFENHAGSIVHSDSFINFATYYLDESVVVRAHRETRLDDEEALVPDPWESGDPVQCFD